jgi:prephenate dehydrogenase
MESLSKIAIIGTGLIGGSIGLSLGRKKLCAQICGIDEFSVIHHALERGVISEGFTPPDLAKAVKGAEVIFICTPIEKIMDFIPKLKPLVDKHAIICDVGSTKVQIVHYAAKYFTDDSAYFLGSHPMAGSELKGVESADPYLFENTVWVLTPYQMVPDEYIRKIGNLLEGLGARVLLLSPEQHDKVASAVSHLPQMIAIALTNLISKFHHENPNYVKLAAGGFRDMTRIASSPYSLWKEICKTNTNQIVYFIDEFIAELSQLKQRLVNNQIETDFEKAIVTRLAIPKDTKGFLKPAYEISVGVEDKPGVIAKLSTILADNNINIKDIEVLKIREGEGGTFRMAFSSEQDRKKAIELIHSIGFSCYPRE